MILLPRKLSKNSKALKPLFVFKKVEQERIIEIARVEQIARQLEVNLQLIENEIAELEEFKNNLNFLINSKELGILSSIGKRVFVKTKIEDKDKLFIEVGAGVVVKKSPKDALKIIEKQISRLKEAGLQIASQLESYRGQLEEFLREIQVGD